ncbi:succinyldiaminopimelate transaminase [Litorihabitans aurantiacus]|uniref:Aminotransferase n=1 Tax=Litorihabitans aurantiacus TaxID=1930061 RepID=A0AA37XB18_9MICO|nr:succinyldiaminopimelate transaminase [Litorihabitans aurantiacus]GMA30584.1 aminotransferase [Litorihabitans aurantiacus]
MGFHRLEAAYPWDAVVPLRERAAQHPGGLCDLSIGTPVDPTPDVVRDALAAASDAHGYPTVAGTRELRAAVADFLMRRRGSVELTPEAVLPTIGSKELVALLPSQLGLGPGDVVVIPTAAYPTYEVGARLAGAQVVASDDPGQWAGREEVALVWLNSPSNPTGEVMSAERMAAVVRAAREVGAVVASDECYALLPWVAPWTDPAPQGGGVPSILDARVNGGDLRGLLAVHSLSKQSNLAGYRAAFAAGDATLVDELLQQRRHLGMMLPWPVQQAMVAALGDDAHVEAQVERYRARREVLLGALLRAGFEVDHSEAGLYLWVRAGERDGAAPVSEGSKGTATTDATDGDDEAPCWALMRWFAERGVVAGPGVFYGAAAAGHVRLSLTASDERIAAAASRLTPAT